MQESNMTYMRFCPECNNMLYPREDRVQKTLLYGCRQCPYSQPAESFCVYRNEIQHTVGEKTQFLDDVGADPTLPRTKTVTCGKCGHQEAVFFQATSRGEDQMAIFFVCCAPNCGHRWRE